MPRHRIGAGTSPRGRGVRRRHVRTAEPPFLAFGVRARWWEWTGRQEWVGSPSVSHLERGGGKRSTRSRLRRGRTGLEGANMSSASASVRSSQVGNTEHTLVTSPEWVLESKGTERETYNGRGTDLGGVGVGGLLMLTTTSERASTRAQERAHRKIGLAGGEMGVEQGGGENALAFKASGVA